MSHRSVVRRFVLVGLVLPVIVATAGVVVLVAVIPHLPDPVAVHWGADGAADGFGPPWMPAVVLAVAGLLLPLLACGLLLPGIRRDGGGTVYRFVATMSLGLASFITVLTVVSTIGQVGLTDAADAGSIGPALLASTVTGAGLGVAGWFLQPAQRFTPTSPTTPPEPGVVTAEAVDADTVWRGRVTIARGGLIVLGSALAVLVAAGVFTIATTPPGWPWVIVVGLSLLLAVIIAANAVFEVRIDADGLTVSSMLGWPHTHVAAGEVDDVRAVEVSPFAEFGGWGWRWAGGRTGIVLRTGPGIEVQRRSGSVLVVTVDDADTAAATLSAFAARA